MEASSLRTDEDRVLLGLLEAFGSTFSLNAIASAFCKAGRDADLAAGFLFDSQQTTTSDQTTTTTITHASNCETNVASSSCLELLLLPESIVDESTGAGRNSKPSKAKKNSVSMGTVSCVLGKGYTRSVATETSEEASSKPVKVDLTGLPPMDELFKEDDDTHSSNSIVRSDTMHKDTEDFLFKMLGKGFQLDMNVIRDVLGCCGYDAKMSVEKLIDISASTLKKSDDIISVSTRKFADKYPEPKSPKSQEKSQYNGFAKSQDKERHDLQREVLASLFSVPERFEELPRRGRPIRAIKKRRSVGKLVFEPLKDTSPEHSTDIVESQQDFEDEKEEDSYQVLRRATKEHWITMKEYYKAAADAFANGDRAIADKLLEEGEHFNNKAREADDKSNQAILGSRKKESQDDFAIDLHDHDKKEAISLLKLHLTTLSGIPSFEHLKVILETDAAEDTTKGSRKRLVIKLLERESIKWSEDEKNPGTILIKLDEINPKKLSFAKKAV